VGVVQLLRSSAVWAIIVVNIVNHWGYFIYLNWIPSYFYKVKAVSDRVVLIRCLAGAEMLVPNQYSVHGLSSLPGPGSGPESVRICVAAAMDSHGRRFLSRWCAGRWPGRTRRGSCQSSKGTLTTQDVVLAHRHHQRENTFGTGLFSIWLLVHAGAADCCVPWSSAGIDAAVTARHLPQHGHRLYDSCAGHHITGWAMLAPHSDVVHGVEHNIRPANQTYFTRPNSIVSGTL
jgi:hypothetical protein